MAPAVRTQAATESQLSLAWPNIVEVERLIRCLPAVNAGTTACEKSDFEMLKLSAYPNRKSGMESCEAGWPAAQKSRLRWPVRLSVVVIASLELEADVKAVAKGIKVKRGRDLLGVPL